MKPTAADYPPETAATAPLRDAAERARALDVTKSFIVQAPAGSGKTELLTDRFLKLLSVVDEPEEVLAITFARGATAEMRTRILEKLEAAQEHASDANYPAAEALRRSQQRGWRLLEQPQRLRIDTIDALCLSIAHRMPLLARLGGDLRPTENAGPLYDLAAEQTLQQLGGPNDELNAALRGMLTLRDNNLADCERLIAEMLKQRDQWAHLFLLSGDVDWSEVRAQFESPFQEEIRRVLGKAHALVSQSPGLAAELVALGRYACGNLDPDHELRILQGLEALPDAGPEFAAHWECLTKLVMTKGDSWRKSWGTAEGFPSGGKRSQGSGGTAKDRIRKLTTDLEAVPGLLEALCEIRNLPTPRYTDAQWAVLLQIFTILRHATAQLKVIFAERNVVDFMEVGMAAEMVLRAPDLALADESAQPLDHALAIGDRIRHLLVDEFQDISRRQHQLLASLLRGWDNCDGRTCFFVGDPMQSIYLFRQAEVELFGRVSRHGISCDDTIVELDTLQLRTNFRTHSGLVGPVNELFEAVAGQPKTSEIGFTPSVASKPGMPNALHVHTDILPKAPDIEQKRAARARETDTVLEIVQAYLPQLQKAGTTPNAPFTVGILVRAKKHAASIAAALRDAAIPFRAVELEPLGDRQEILDLLALVRALAHPMDRVGWLSVLRAPWCGLELRDLHALCGTDSRESTYAPEPPVLELLQSSMEGLSPDGRLRASRTRDTLLVALDPQKRLSASTSFTSWVEQTWYGLGGHHCVDQTGHENVRTFFSMLDEMERNGIAPSAATIKAQSSRLSAQPDSAAEERNGVQIMTIHKAKGLGFDVVIVPGLERGTTSDRYPLVCWLQRSCAAEPVHGPRDEVLVAPIGEKGPKPGRLYRWVREQRTKREEQERKRLLYVACTRAAQELHLLGAATQTDSGLKPGDNGSLLATAWPALRLVFEQAAGSSGQPDRGMSDAEKVLVFPERGADDRTEHETVVDIAAEQDLVPPLPRIRLRRLPLDLAPRPLLENVTAAAQSLDLMVEQDLEMGAPAPFTRPEGSIEARAVGTAVHALFEKAARLIEAGTSISELRAALPRWKNHAASILRNNGIAHAEGRHPSGAARLADRAVEAVSRAIDDPVGRWILSPHPGAQSETAWTGMLDGAIRTLRADRIFRAGSLPMGLGDDCLWIIDYKTASRDPAEADEFLKLEREKYEDQLQMYGRMLRLAKGNSTELRLGLYYPFLQRLEHWPM